MSRENDPRPARLNLMLDLNYCETISYNISFNLHDKRAKLPIKLIIEVNAASMIVGSRKKASTKNGSRNF